MKLFLEPTIESLKNDYEENDFMDEEQFDEELLVRQGYESETMEVEDGEEFEIPEGMCASVMVNEKDTSGEYEFDEDDEEVYQLYVEVDDGVWAEEPIQGNLQAGRYELDGHLIKVIELYEN